MEPKEIPSRLIFRLLVVSTWQLEILVTTLFWVFAYKRFDCSTCSTRDGKGSVTDLGAQNPFHFRSKPALQGQ